MWDNINDFKENFNWVKTLTSAQYEAAALCIFRYQAKENEIYKAYLKAIHRSPDDVQQLTDIPFLPISFFKTHKVLCKDGDATDYFESSGTSGTINSKHWLPRLDLYETCFLHHFERAYGSVEDYQFFFLLPHYLERRHSSLVYMAKGLLEKSGQTEKAFYLDDFKGLAKDLTASLKGVKKVMLLGVTFALLDFAAAFPMDLSRAIVMETGGMKGRREEWTRQQVHEFLMNHWQLSSVHSEYGMSELLSQAYSKGGGLYTPANTMHLSVRDETDPFSNFKSGKGCLNIMDLGNLFTCAFIATDDLAVIHPSGDFEIRGRVDYSALRGCSLMAL